MQKWRIVTDMTGIPKCWVSSKVASVTSFDVFGMAQSRNEPATSQSRSGRYTTLANETGMIRCLYNTLRNIDPSYKNDNFHRQTWNY